MPLRTVLGLEHIDSIDVRAGSLPARVVVMTEYEARWWDEHVQRYIDDFPSDRADKKWIWPRILTNRALVAGLLLQEPVAYVIEVPSDGDGQFRPAVMLMLVDRYPYLPQHDVSSVFVWYLSPAPRDYFVQKLRFAADKVPASKELMAIGMDVAITESFNSRLRGRLGLHAAPEGGDKLVDWYGSPDGARMKPLPSGASLPAGMRSAFDRLKLVIRGNLRAKNDGRYFYHDETTAFSASVRMDRCRGRGA